MLDALNARLSIRARLILVSLLFLVAAAFASALLFMQARDNMSASQMERDGLVVMRNLWTATKSNGPFDTAAVQVYATQERLAAVTSASDAENRLDAMTDLMVSVADGSSMTLDTDVDSFYDMQGFVTALPNLFMNATDVAEAAKAGKTVTADGDSAAMILDHMHDVTMAFENAMTANAEGKTKAALRDPLTALDKAAQAFVAAVKAGQPGTAEFAELSGAIDRMWQAGADEFDRLVANRIDGAQSQLEFRLGLVALALVLAIAFAVIVATGLGRRFKALTAVMDKLRDGEFKVDVPYLNDRHETGKIADTLKVLRDATAARVEEDARRLEEAELGATGMVNAISRAQAMIEFKPDGTVVSANENFLRVVRYREDEIVGKHHRMFCDPAYVASAEYDALWSKLRNGEYVADKFRRLNKDGKELWLQASYNPIADKTGKVVKVVKFATDITQVENDRKIADAERAARTAEQTQVVNGLAAGLKALAAGDLTNRLETPFAGDYEALRNDFNDAVDRLRDAMKGIVTNAGGIRSGAGEISQAADDLSRRTEQQAASLEETAAALDEITATVRKSAESAKQANAVVAATKGNAEASGVVVSETVGAMAEIEKSSKQISQIIGVIDEIAFQTNLLALNAGVEAARAGDAGRGFAVVASEVRALAQRSSEAAKEIKGLISASSQHVEAGVKLVGDAGKALGTIVERVQEISSLVSEIAASAQEQSTALGEVNTAINQMDQVTQQNAAMVEESTAASHSLNQEAAELMNLISHFKAGVEVEAPAAQRTARKAEPAPSRKPQTIGEQKRRVAQFATEGNAAVRSTDSDWEEF